MFSHRTFPDGAERSRVVYAENPSSIIHAFTRSCAEESVLPVKWIFPTKFISGYSLSRALSAPDPDEEALVENVYTCLSEKS